MEVNYNIISLLDFLALVQGVLLGTILILRNRKDRPSLLLGLFLITYSIELLPSILNDIGLGKDNSNLLFLQVKFFFLSLPLFYLYAKSLLGSFSFKKNWLFFVPGALELLVFIILSLCFEDNLEKRIDFVLFMDIYFITGLIYGLVFAFLTYKLIIKHQKRVLNYFSNTEKKLLNWILLVAIFLIFFSIFWLLSFLLPESIYTNYTYPFLSAVNVIFIFWVGLSGLHQTQVIMANSSDGTVLSKYFDRLTMEKIENEKDDALFAKLDQLMLEKELYKESDLTLPLLAKELKLTREKLSALINNKTLNNFNHFINNYRVKEAQRLLCDLNFRHLNMIGISNEVGFNSKATFFAVFKKISGVSPGVYKKLHG